MRPSIGSASSGWRSTASLQRLLTHRILPRLRTRQGLPSHLSRLSAQGHRPLPLRPHHHSLRRAIPGFPIPQLEQPDSVASEFGSEFARSLPCLRRLERQLDDVCLPRCGDTALIKARIRSQMGRLRSEADLARAEPLMDHGCKNAECRLACETPLLAEECGEEAAALMRAFVASTTANIKGSYQRMNAHAYWPDSCEELVAMMAPGNPSASRLLLSSTLVFVWLALPLLFR